MKRCRLLLILGALPAIGWAQSSFDTARGQQTTDAFAVSACSSGVASEVRKRQPMAANVLVTDSTTSPAGSDQTDVSGKGTFTDTMGPARSFTFTCSYDLRKQAASSVSVMI